MTTATNTLTTEWIEALEERGFATTDKDSQDKLSALVEICEDWGVDASDFEDFYQGEVEGYSAEDAGRNFAMQLAEDCGDAIPDRWPHRHIDWLSAWQELEQGDGYRVHLVPGTHDTYWVTRSC